MILIRVPKPPKSAYDPGRPMSSLLKSQIEHLREAESKLPLHYRSDVYVKAIKTEGEAAKYIRDVTEAIHEAHEDAERARRAPKRKRVIEIAAAANERNKPKRVRPSRRDETPEERRCKRKKNETHAGGRMRWSAGVILWLVSTAALAQESWVHADFRREGERVADACTFHSFMSVAGCAYTLFTDHPLHIAAGSMPPQNGFGLGAAFVVTRNTQNWRLSWNVDAVAATSGSWRAGGYLKLVHTPVEPVHVSIPSSAAGGQPAKRRSMKCESILTQCSTSTRRPFH